MTEPIPNTNPFLSNTDTVNDVNDYITISNPLLTIEEFLDFNPSELVGLNTDFIIAGEFTHNTLKHIVSEKVDFWIMNEKGFTYLLDYFSKYFDNIKYSIFESKIELQIDDYGLIILHKSFGLNISQILKSFPFDYLCSYFDGKNIIVSPKGIDQMKTREIYKFNNHLDVCESSIYKALDNKYNLDIDLYYDTEEYWNYQNDKILYDDNKMYYNEYLSNYNINILKEKKSIMSIYDFNTVNKILPLFLKETKLNLEQIVKHLNLIYIQQDSPKIYRGFFIKNDKFKKQIDSIYTILEIDISENIYTKKEYNIPHDELIKVLDLFTENPYMKYILSNVSNNNENDNQFKTTFEKMLTMSFSNLILKYIHENGCFTNCIDKTEINWKICKYVLKYFEMLTDTLKIKYIKFIKVLISKYISFSSIDGCPISWLVVNYLDDYFKNTYNINLFTEDYQLYLNKDSKIYVHFVKIIKDKTLCDLGFDKKLDDFMREKSKYIF